MDHRAIMSLAPRAWFKSANVYPQLALWAIDMAPAEAGFEE